MHERQDDLRGPLIRLGKVLDVEDGTFPLSSHIAESLLQIWYAML